MKLLYTCADRADDPHLWSGIVWNCRQGLLDADVEIAVFDRIPFECPIGLRLWSQGHKVFGQKTHFLQIEPAILRRAAQRITARFDQGDCDAIFCPGTGVAVYAFLPRRLPVFTYLDATKRSWIDSYFGLDSLCDRSRGQVSELDRAALRNNTLSIFSSDWARAEAARDYGIPVESMAVVPFGANLTNPPSRADVEGWVDGRAGRPLRLLFLGIDWERKGGPEALAMVRELRQRGVPATLEIVGCSPVLSAADNVAARVHGFIDHSSPVGREIFHTILRESHGLLFLSRAEAYGIALCEAAAFGVPAYANAVGGIPTIVRDGVTGWLGNLPFSPVAAAARLATIWGSPDEYRRIALATRADFETRLNWGAAGRSLRSHIESALSRRRAD